MQAVVGCRVEDMEEQIGQPKLCWFCANIVHCNPSVRPQCDCKSYKPLGRYITHQHIADWIGISRQRLNTIINRYGIYKTAETFGVDGCELNRQIERIGKNIVAQRLGITENKFDYLIRKNGAEKVIELLEIRGHIVRYEVVCEYVKFYELGEKK